MRSAGPTPSDGSLRERWTVALAEGALRTLRSGAPRSPFGRTGAANGDGRHDFRGISFREPIRNLEGNGIDFTAATVAEAGMLVRVTLRDCLFLRASLGTNLSGDLRGCDFSNADLAGLNLSGDSRLDHCAFDGANLNRSMASYATFEHCGFVGARMRGAHLLHCVFHECSWTGVQFHHASFAGSWITAAGFPSERGVQRADALLPDVILDNVHWMDPADPATLHTGPVREAELTALYRDSYLSLRLRFREYLDKGRGKGDIAELAQSPEDPALTGAERVAVQAARDAYHAYQVDEGKRHFKAAEYDRAFSAFSEAAAFGDLEPSSERYRSIARQRAGLERSQR